MEEDEYCGFAIGVMIREALRKLGVLSWCIQNHQLYDTTKTYSIGSLLNDKRQGLNEILSEITASTDGQHSRVSLGDGTFRASSSSGEERLYYDRVEYVERGKEIHRLAQRLKLLKYQCHEMNQKLHIESQIEMTRHRFATYSEAARKEQQQHTISSRVQDLQTERRNKTLHKNRAIEAAAVIERFYHWKLETTEQEIEGWMNRFDREKEDQDSRFQKARATEKLWNELKQTYEQDRQEIDVLEKELAVWLEKMVHKELCERMATKLQAWWRGVMVRKKLGRYAPPGAKKTKGKGKGSKKSKTKKF